METNKLEYIVFRLCVVFLCTRYRMFVVFIDVDVLLVKSTNQLCNLENLYMHIFFDAWRLTET